MAGELVVIVDADGNEHQFPAGFDPKRAAAIVRQQTAKPEAPAAPAPTPQPANESIFTRLGRAITSAQSGVAQTMAHPEVVKGQVEVIPEVTTGAAKGTASTLFHGGDLLRRGSNYLAGTNYPLKTEDPKVRALITPSSPLQQVGFGAEQAAEFVVPASKVAGATRGVGLLGRAAADAATGAAVSAVQSGGDAGEVATNAAIGAVLPFGGAALKGAKRGVEAATGAAGRAAAGASEGGIGGALAGVVRGAAPVEPRQMLVQALKPRNTRINFESAMDVALPEVKATGKPVTNIQELIDATKAAKQANREQFNAIAGPYREMGSTVDLTPVADAQVKSIPKTLRLENPEAAARLEAQADVYRKRFNLEDVEQLLQDTNAELEAYYAKFPTAQHRALLADPEVARLNAKADALRTALYTTLGDSAQGGAARELQRRYGALIELQDAAQRRAIVAGRQQPMSLSEQIAEAGGMADRAAGIYRMGRAAVTGNLGDAIAGGADMVRGQVRRETAKAIKESQTTDALIRRAFENYKGTHKPVPMPTRRPTAGLLGPGPILTPPPADTSFVRGVPADRVRGIDLKPVSVRDPKTGRVRRVFTSEAAPDAK